MRTRILSALLVALMSMPGALSAQASDVKLDEVMSAQDQMATGVANLSAAQRQSLERWLARYTGTVAAVMLAFDAFQLFGSDRASGSPAASTR